MITSFEVGAVFQIIDRASPVLRSLMGEVKALSAEVTALERNLQRMGAGTSLRPLAGMLATLRGEMTGVSTAATGMAAAVNRDFATMNARMATATANANALAAAFGRAAAAAAGARLPGGGGTPRIPGAGGGGGPHGPGIHGRFGIPMAGGHASIGGISPGLIGMGVGAFAIGEVMRAGMEPAHQKAMLGLMGLTPAQREQASAQAWATARAVPGSTFAGNLETIGQQYSIVGMEGSLELNKPMAAMDQVLARVGKGDKGSGYVMTRAVELMGMLTDPETHQVDMPAFQRILGVMTKATIATHGKVTPADFLALAKQGGPALGSLSEEGLFTEVAIMQAMGGNRAGTAAAALQRQFAGAKMTGSVAKELMSLGIAKEGDLTIERGGHVFAKSDAMKGLVDRMQHDPLGAIVDVIVPALAAKGFNSPEAISREIYKFVGTGPAQREVYELIRGREQIKQERGRMQGAEGPDAASRTLNNEDPEQVMANLTSGLHNFLGALGDPLWASATPTLNALAASLTRLGAALGTAPKVVQRVESSVLRAIPGVGGVIGAIDAFNWFAGGSAAGAAPAPPRGAPPTAPGAEGAAGGVGGLSKLADTMTFTFTGATGDPKEHAEMFADHLAKMLAVTQTHNLDEGAGSYQSPWTGGR